MTDEELTRAICARARDAGIDIKPYGINIPRHELDLDHERWLDQRRAKRLAIQRTRRRREKQMIRDITQVGLGISIGYLYTMCGVSYSLAISGLVGSYMFFQALENSYLAVSK